MRRSDRALLVVTALSCGGVARLRPLYRLLDGAMALLGRIAGLGYGRRVVLRGRACSGEGVGAALTALCGAPGIAAVDVLLNVHGQPGALTLADGDLPVLALAARLRALGAGAGKLRLLYSTACHASHHGPALRAAGFRTCLGARAINTSGAFEAPVFLTLWAGGISAGRALRVADHPLARRPADAVARVVLRAVGERGAVDSGKVLLGSEGVTIRSP